MPPGGHPIAGFSTLRLEGLEKRSSLEKAQLVYSIADDMSATLMCIAQHTEEGTLSARHIEPIDRVIRIVRDTEVSQRRRLERRVRRLRGRRRWLRREFRKMIKRAELVSVAWKNKATTLKGNLQALQSEVASMRRQCEMLRAYMEQRESGEKEESMLGEQPNKKDGRAH
ncbi:hypothetical protein N7474_006342 [Penicillium riverlandense]|uniref:uncharacterized protein n=1 Tax=Penicillium riverlandense TaxID=1903569 RepID=UPI002548E43F|nr:uncharacterized protein N7474_006342 [Penicillium riverlandense]KAJ5814565.1 hypothetical protein N7474_006342 [Penicillium riverlandense]